MLNHTLKVLEYRSILDRLVFHSRSVPGKRRSGNLLPYSNVEVINDALDLLSEMNEIFDFDGGPPGLEFDDLGEKMDRARSSGDIFEPKELLEFAAFFAIIRDCLKIRPQYKKIRALLSGLHYPGDLHDEIEKTVDQSGEIKDSASPELKRIRKELMAIKGKLNERFEKYSEIGYILIFIR